MYLTYPQIVQTLSAQFDFEQLKQSLPIKKDTINQMEILVSGVKEKKIQTASKQLIPVDILVRRLSFSHFVELIKCENDLQRTFYELESIKGTWAVRELKRQMNSLLFERTGLSKNKEKLLLLANNKSLKISAEELIRDPYFFEFVGLSPKDVYTLKPEGSPNNHLIISILCFYLFHLFGSNKMS